MTPTAHPARVYDIATALLATAAATWTGTGRDAPIRQYVEHVGPPNLGPVADGCDRLVVYVGAIRATHGSAGRDQPGGRPGATMLARVVDLTVEVLRCGTPQPTQATAKSTVVPPAPSDIDAHAALLLHDAWVLFDGVLAARRAKVLFGSELAECCEQLRLGDLTPYGPFGNIAGWRWPLSVTVTP